MPLVSLIPVVHLDFEKFEMTLVLFSGAWGKMIHEKNLKQKILNAFCCGECEVLCFFYNTISNCFISVKEIHWKRPTLFPVVYLLHREKKHYERER